MHKLTCLLAAALLMSLPLDLTAQSDCGPAESQYEFAAYFLTATSFTAGVNEVRCVQVEPIPFGLGTIDLDVTATLTFEGEQPPGILLVDDGENVQRLDANGEVIEIPVTRVEITIIPLREGTATIVLEQDGGSSFFDFTIERTFTVLANPAPVTWTRPLTHAPAGPDLELSWGVAEQVDVAGYTLERQNGADWEALQDVAYVESGAAEVVYTTRTPRPAGDAYYRIRQTDFDGSSSLSNVVHVPATEATALRVFPNPATGQANFTLPPAATFLTLTDATGRQVRNLAGAQLGDRRIDLGGLPAGLYTLTAYGRDARLGSERLLVH